MCSERDLVKKNIDELLQYPSLLGLKNLSATEINQLLDQASAIKELFSRPIKQVPALRGKTIANLFFEPSTRTRISFEQAIKKLGASSLNVSIAQSSVKKGESLLDTVRNIEAMGVDALVVRHASAGVPEFIARNCNVPVICAGDGFNEHPTQGLLDIFTMREKKGDLAGKKVTIVGDILHSRVARSNIWGLRALGADVTLCGPSSLIPDAFKDYCTVNYRLEEAIENADFINVLRVQFERQKSGFFPTTREYREFYGLTTERLKYAKEDVTILHPGPINRGVEIDSDVADGSKNVILDQVLNGVVVRMAVLYCYVMGLEKNPPKNNLYTEDKVGNG
jgi:aspartate carbamoyltransferase catalytic subunit